MLNRAIITAASAAYTRQLFALLGSLNANWPTHPPIIVYDLGLADDALEKLGSRQIEVRKVPEFCPHWRKHFTWKIWCWNDIDADAFLWMDAGMAVLKPLDELFQHIEKIGYAVFPNYRLLEEEASEEACRGCGVEPSFRQGKTTLAGTIIGFNKKNGQISSILQKSMELALIEKNLKATDPRHRHDQALMSLLIYKEIELPIFLDGNIYLGEPSPILVPSQKVWACRRSMLVNDIQSYTDFFLGKVENAPICPETPRGKHSRIIYDALYQINRIYGIKNEDIGIQLLTRDFGPRGKKIVAWIISVIVKIHPKRRHDGEKIRVYDGVRE